MPYLLWDLGGVLIDWNPRYLYSKMMSEVEMDSFLTKVCTMDWNEQQDGGRTIAEGTDQLIHKFPVYERQIRAYYGRWEEMLRGPIQESVDLLRACDDAGVKQYALTNWSAETFPIALERYDFLEIFQGIVVSGREGIKKPDPRIYHLVLERYELSPQHGLFIDDNLRNIRAAETLGLSVHHFTTANKLKERLQAYVN